MEFCGSRTLADIIKGNKKSTPGADQNEDYFGFSLDIKALFLQLLAGVSFMHSQNVYHRDLKLENILVTKKDELKIVDFGLSVKPKNVGADQEVFTQICGTPLYFSPQMMGSKPYSAESVDIWCIGVVLFYLVYHRHPFFNIPGKKTSNMGGTSYLSSKFPLTVQTSGLTETTTSKIFLIATSSFLHSVPEAPLNLLPRRSFSETY